MVQGLGLHASTTEGTGLIPGLGTKILHASWRSQKKKEKKKIRVRGIKKILLEFC